MYRKTIYNVVRIETDGYAWILTHSYGDVKKESRDDYPELQVS